MKLKYVFCMLIVAVGFTALPARALSLIIEIAPPPARIEAVPQPRSGFVWAPGYWRPEGLRHVWVRGYWIRERPGYLWVPERWVREDRGYRFEPGKWERRDRKQPLRFAKDRKRRDDRTWGRHDMKDGTRDSGDRGKRDIKPGGPHDKAVKQSDRGGGPGNDRGRR